MDYTVLDYLEKTAEKFPDKTAFADLNSSITFSELVIKAKKIAALLSQYFEPTHPVPIMIDKSVRTLEFFFGAVYAGCFYSYFDFSFPDERLNSMIQTLDAKYIIADRKYEKKLSNLNIEPIYCDDIQNQLDILSYNESIRSAIIDTDPLYANFTSGSTGTPKAVTVNHRSVIDFISCFTELFDIKSTDNIANQAPFDFDVSVKDIFSGIFTGATVHLIPKMFFSFPTKLLDYLVEREITVIIWAVSAMCIISTLNGFDYKVPDKLRTIMFSGEVMPCKQLEVWIKHIPNAQYINLYGPTEITCNCTYYMIPHNTIPESIPIGIPFPNERVFLLDEDNKIVTDKNVSGEICVSGTCVALGYYNSERTNEVFIQNPNNTRHFERIYKTGDLGLYGQDGLLYYIGRKDSQIKHMGHRIELGEIEKVLNGFEPVSRSCCIFKNNEISAFYTGTETEKKDIVTYLKKILPAYMVPANIIFLPDFPITKNGKIDKRVLEEKL